MMAYINVVILIIGFLLIHYYLKSYLPEFFKEKGKNLATKEDIGEITNIIKSVESKFNKDIELHKVQLDILKNDTLRQFEDEKSALYEYLGKIQNWSLILYNINFDQLRKNKVNDVLQLRLSLDNFVDVSISLSKVKLLVQNAELIKEAIQLFLSILNYKKDVELEIYAIQRKLEKKEFLLLEFYKKFPDNDNTPQIFFEAIDQDFFHSDLKIEKIHIELLSLTDEYLQDKKYNLYKKYKDIEDTFVETTKNYIFHSLRFSASNIKFNPSE